MCPLPEVHLDCEDRKSDDTWECTPMLQKGPWMAALTAPKPDWLCLGAVSILHPEFPLDGSSASQFGIPGTWVAMRDTKFAVPDNQCFTMCNWRPSVCWYKTLLWCCHSRLTHDIPSENVGNVVVTSRNPRQFMWDKCMWRSQALFFHS